MAKLNRICTVCGKQYSYCSTCADDLGKPAWMISFHDENCKDIYTACAGYNTGNMNKEEAKLILDKCDLSEKEKYSNATKKAISDIYSPTPLLSKEVVVEDKKAEPKVIVEKDVEEKVDNVQLQTKQNTTKYKQKLASVNTKAKNKK